MSSKQGPHVVGMRTAANDAGPRHSGAVMTHGISAGAAA